MPDDLYERYKEALRTGHVAVLRGALSEAIDAYQVAAAIAPSRALPHTSLGGVFLRLGNLQEALDEYEAAVARAPHDEGALLGQAEALTAAGIPTEAAAALDHVADIQEANGRIPEAADTLRRAIELDETADRSRRQRALLRELKLVAGDHGADELLARALRLREDGPEGQQLESQATATSRLEAQPQAPLSAGGERPGAGTPRMEPRPEPPFMPRPVVEPATSRPASAEIPPQPALQTDRPALRLPEAGPVSEPAERVPVMADAEDVRAGAAPGAIGESAHQPTGDELLAAAEAADHAGDTTALRSLLVWTARAYAREGRFDAGIDATHRLLQRAPGDVDAHLVLVELYVARSWDSLATEKLKLLDRLAQLNGDEETHQRVCAAASRAFPSDQSLENICA